MSTERTNAHLHRCLLTGFFMLLVLGWTATSWAENLYCDYCKKRISGQYYKAHKKVACKKCYDRYDKCPGCNMPVHMGSHRYKGKRVCTDCARRAGLCGNCGDALIGRYYPAKAVDSVKGFCEKCYKTQPRCIVCDLPYQAMFKTTKGPICRHCRSKIDKCGCCNEPIVGSYFTVEFVEGKFCEDCFKNKPHCDFCGRPLGTGGQTLADKRHSCAKCSKDAVKTLEDATKHLQAMAQFCESELDIPPPRPFDFVIVNNEQMNLIASKHRRYTRKPKSEFPSKLRELGFFDSNLTPHSPRATLAILSDLPRAAFMETLAHEYAHLYQFAVNPALKDPVAIEGFAQWVAGKWLLHNKEYAAFSKLASREDPIYGKGLMKMLEIEKRSGKKGVMLYIKDYQKKKNAKPYKTQHPTLKPLHEIMPVSFLDGPYGFLKNAVVMTPELLQEKISPLDDKQHYGDR